MNIALTPKTRKLVEKQLDTGLFAGPDDVLRLALQTLEQIKVADYDDLDTDTRQAIEHAESEFARGEFKPWNKVRAKLRKRFVK